MSTRLRYGIDFGTTNSSIAIVELNNTGLRNPKVFKVDFKNEPYEVLKSVVGYKDKEEIVGDDGLYHLRGSEDNPIREVKMKLLANEKDGDIPSLPGKRYSDIMAAILRKLKEAADRDILARNGFLPKGVVIGIPCEINNDQERIKYAYCMALYKAGFYDSIDEAKEDTIFLDEPCAVALYYGNQAIHQNKTTMIFDFGGGTLDLAVVNLKQQSLNDKVPKGVHEVIAKASLYSAGELFTEILFKNVFFPSYRDYHCNGSAWEVAKLFRKLGCRATRPEDIYRELTYKAGACWGFIKELEKAKANLSFYDSYDFYFEAEFQNEKVIFNTTTLYRSEFENALRPQLKEIEEFIKKNLFTPKLKKEKGITKESLESVILAGGSSSVPCVRHMLMDMFPDKVTYDRKKQGQYYVNMMTCISQGLAIQGYYETPSDIIDNVTAYSYGFWNDSQKQVEVVIPKNTNFSATDIDLSENTLLPQTEYYRDVSQTDMSKKAFHVDIYEDHNKIMRLNFNKSVHSGYYRIYFRIDPSKGVLEIKVYDSGNFKWLTDLDVEERQYKIIE